MGDYGSDFDALQSHATRECSASCPFRSPLSSLLGFEDDDGHPLVVHGRQPVASDEPGLTPYGGHNLLLDQLLGRAGLRWVNGHVDDNCVHLLLLQSPANIPMRVAIHHANRG